MWCYFHFASYPLNIYSDRTTFLRDFKLKYIKMLMLVILGENFAIKYTYLIHLEYMIWR